MLCNMPPNDTKFFYLKKGQNKSSCLPSNWQFHEMGGLNFYFYFLKPFLATLIELVGRY
jgi:hypothetical protein